MHRSKLNLFFLVLIILFLPVSVGAQEPTDTLRAFSNTEPQKTENDSLSMQNAAKVEHIVNYAKKYLGTPYRSAGMTPSGFDCSGFIGYILGNFGLNLGRSSYTMAEYGKTVKLSEIQPGDLMFFKGSNVKSTRVGHVGMVVEVSEEGIKFIHSSTSRGVIIDNFKTSRYYIPRYVTTKRLDFGNSGK